MSLETLYRRAPAPMQELLLNAQAVRIGLHRYGRAYRKATAELLGHERWSRQRFRDYQDARLREVVRVAYEETRYYRRLMDERGITPEDIRGVGDLPRLPLLEKATVKASEEGMMTSSRPQRGWIHGHTSGTTGTPLGIWYDRWTCVLTNAVDRRQKIWGGMKDDAWLGLFLGRVVVPPSHDDGRYWRVNHVQRQVWFSSFHMSDDRLPAYVAEIRRRELRFLEGYPSTMYILAQHVLDTGAPLPMEAVFTSSETLHDVQREAIEDAFQCSIFDFYGHAERTIYAGDCEVHQGRHIAEEYGFVEVVDASGKTVAPGETGYLVGTSLHNTAMPMIRYRTGDLSQIEEEPCPCGRMSRRIAAVTTKAEDIVVTRDGRLISPSILTHPFKPLQGLLKSQIVQESDELIRVRLVSGSGFAQEDRDQLSAALVDRLGPGMSVVIDEVDDIPNEPSGKFRWVISKVDHSRRFGWDAGRPS